MDEYAFRANHFIDSDGDSLIRELDEVFTTRSVTIGTLRGFPFMRAFNLLIRYIDEAGILDYWLLTYESRNKELYEVFRISKS